MRALIWLLLLVALPAQANKWEPSAPPPLPLDPAVVVGVAAELADGSTVAIKAKGGVWQLKQVGPALASLGFKMGDLVVSVNGQPVKGMADLLTAWRAARAGSPLVVVMTSGGVTTTHGYTVPASTLPPTTIAPRRRPDGKLALHRPSSTSCSRIRTSWPAPSRRWPTPVRRASSSTPFARAARWICSASGTATRS